MNRREMWGKVNRFCTTLKNILRAYTAPCKINFLLNCVQNATKNAASVCFEIMQYFPLIYRNSICTLSETTTFISISRKIRCSSHQYVGKSFFFLLSKLRRSSDTSGNNIDYVDNCDFVDFQLTDVALSTV